MGDVRMGQGSAQAGQIVGNFHRFMGWSSATPQRHRAVCSAPMGGCGCRMAEALTNVNTPHTKGHHQIASGLSELN